MTTSRNTVKAGADTAPASRRIPALFYLLPCLLLAACASKMPGAAANAFQEVPKKVFYKHGDREELRERYDAGKKEADAAWLESQAGLGAPSDIGETASLEILPLVEFNVSGEGLLGEPGVSYLIRTPETSILFDVGFNQDEEGPSPLINNMGLLGVSLSEIGNIFISHTHRDHVGGRKWEEAGTFALGGTQPDLHGIPVYAPVPLSYPGASPVLSAGPTEISTGVASIGAIKTYDFFTGMISEQALAVKVKGKGVILITGCGHQGLGRIIARAKKLFNEPIYAVIGGLHYPVSASRLNIMGVEVQKYFGTGRLPWVPVTLQDVRDAARLLKEEKVGLVAISAHDTSDEALAEFKRLLPDEYRELAVGRRLLID